MFNRRVVNLSLQDKQRQSAIYLLEEKQCSGESKSLTVSQVSEPHLLLISQSVMDTRQVLSTSSSQNKSEKKTTVDLTFLLWNLIFLPPLQLFKQSKKVIKEVTEGHLRQKVAGCFDVDTYLIILLNVYRHNLTFTILLFNFFTSCHHVRKSSYQTCLVFFFFFYNKKYFCTKFLAILGEINIFC